VFHKIIFSNKFDLVLTTNLFLATSAIHFSNVCDQCLGWLTFFYLVFNLCNSVSMQRRSIRKMKWNIVCHLLKLHLHWRSLRHCDCQCQSCTCPFFLGEATTHRVDQDELGLITSLVASPKEDSSKAKATFSNISSV